MSPAVVEVLVGLGSNLDGPTRQIETAFDLLDSMDRTRLQARSSLYRSAPLGGIEQPDFVNAAALLTTDLAPRAFLGELQSIERSRGRERGEIQWGPRVLDLDLLAYGGLSVEEPGLTVPHPGIASRNFVLLPLREIAPDFEIPGLGRVRDLPVDESEPRISKIA